MKSDEAKAYIYIGAAVLVAYVAYKAVSKVGAVGAALGDAASAANKGIATGVGAIGSIFGLPTPDETIDDPAVVRYIIDTEGQMEGSKRGTALAYIRALAMPAGSGHPPVSVFTPDQVSSIGSGPMVWTPNITTGSIYDSSGPTFNDAKTGNWNYY